MTVKELKEELDKLPCHCGVFIANPDDAKKIPYIEVTHVSKGINELDGIVILDKYEEDD
jgi:hypothetical protein